MFYLIKLLVIRWSITERFSRKFIGGFLDNIRFAVRKRGLKQNNQKITNLPNTIFRQSSHVILAIFIQQRLVLLKLYGICLVLLALFEFVIAKV